MERPLLADIVAKVENRSAPKIWRKLILGYLRGCVTFQRHWKGPWLILDETIWSPTSARAKCISGSKNFRPSPQKDFCNNIGAKRPFIRKQHPVTDQLESGSGRGRLTVPSGEPRHQCFGGICEHRGVRRSCFHPVRAERRRSVGDQCDVTPTPSRLRRRISRYIADSAGCRTWRDSNHSKHCYAASRESPVRPIARIGCCVSPQPISYTRPQGRSR